MQTSRRICGRGIDDLTVYMQCLGLRQLAQAVHLLKFVHSGIYASLIVCASWLLKCFLRSPVRQRHFFWLRRLLLKYSHRNSPEKSQAASLHPS